MRLLDAIVQRLSEALKYLAAALLIGVACLIAVDVLMRAVFNMPIIGIAELVANGIVVIAYLQLSYTVRIGAMLRSELLVTWLRGRSRSILEVLSALLGACFFGLIAWASYHPMVQAFVTSEFEGHASFQVPAWPLKAVIVGCSCLAVVNYLAIALKVALGGQPPKTETGVNGDGMKAS